MTASPALSCPQCRRPLEAAAWRDAGAGRCGRCATEFEFIAFPAFTASPVRAAARAAAVAEEASCFFHAENRAEAVCAGCGRLLCPVCTLTAGERQTCPACHAAQKAAGAAPVARARALYDRIALTLALAPILIWPVTLITAPLALGYVFHAWKKPGSLVSGMSRTRLVAAALIAGLEIAAWVALGLFFWLRHKTRHG